MKDCLEIIEEQLFQKDCGDVVLNFEMTQGTFLNVLPWLASDLLPRAIERGFRKAGIIRSLDPNAQLSIEKSLELNDEFEGQLFEDMDTAIKWIVQKVYTEEVLPRILESRLVFKENDKYQFVELDEILYLQTVKEGTRIQLHDSSFMANHSLKSFISILPFGYMQIHRSYVANLNQVSSFKYHAAGSYRIFFKSFPDTPIPVSKKYATDMKKWFNL